MPALTFRKMTEAPAWRTDIRAGCKTRGMRFREVIVSLVYVEYVFGDMTIDEAAEEGRGQTTKGPVSWVKSLHFSIARMGCM